MKYIEPIVIQENEVHSMILGQIKKNSSVLEFGAASGRMTTYLKNMLGCVVSIVEINEEAYKNALQYAYDGICTNIEDFLWLKKWERKKFDYILFVDVLEHLKNPGEVLRKASFLLKDNGYVFLSLPNVAHNDIFLKLRDGSFDYTEEGLLDETHIHLFAENNLEEFIRKADLYIEQIQHKTIPTGGSEQFFGRDVHIDPDFQRVLLERKNGEVYQFVIKAGKSKNDCDLEKVKKYSKLTGKLYFDYGEGYFEDTVRYVDATRKEKGLYEIKLDLNVEKEVKKVRLDPIEGMQCIVKKCEVYCDGTALDSVWGRCINPILGEVLLAGSDPYVEWELPQESGNVRGMIEFSIDAEYIQNRTFLYLETLLENEKKEDK